MLQPADALTHVHPTFLDSPRAPPLAVLGINIFPTVTPGLAFPITRLSYLYGGLKDEVRLLGNREET